MIVYFIRCRRFFRKTQKHFDTIVIMMMIITNTTPAKVKFTMELTDVKSLLMVTGLTAIEN